MSAAFASLIMYAVPIIQDQYYKLILAVGPAPICSARVSRARSKVSSSTKRGACRCRVQEFPQ
jgi:hypothetical protein